MRHIGESRIYVVPELSTDNEQWINPNFGSPDLRMHYANIKQIVKEKTGRAMQGTQRQERQDSQDCGMLPHTWRSAACQVEHHTGRRA